MQLRPWKPQRRSRPVPVKYVWTALLASLMAVTFLAEHPEILLVLGIIAAGATALWLLVQTQKHRRNILTQATIAEYRKLDPKRFEYALAQLCHRDGCRDVHVVGGAGDLAADVIATTPDGRRILIQAKRYKAGNPVRSPALQAVNGTYRDVHGAHLAAVVTTSSFTADARAFANKVGIRCIDEHALAAWASQTGPAPWQ